MWSHYSNNHSGVCLKFELRKDFNLENSVLPVFYKDELIDSQNKSDLKKCLLTKLNTWNIEKEWRIISDKEKFSFKQEALVEIVFGLKVKESTIKWFEQFAENVYYYDTQISFLKIRGNRLVKVDRFGEVITNKTEPTQSSDFKPF